MGDRVYKTTDAQREASTKYYWADPARGHGKHLQRKFGLSLADYNKMLADQGGVCKLCGGVTPGGMRLAVDHDHNTGKVRGLLCQRCNVHLGWYEALTVERANEFDAYLGGN